MKASELRLLEDRIVVRLERNLKSEVLDLSPVGELPTAATVLHVGPGARDKKGRLQPMEVKPGDRVRFFPRAGTDMTFEKEDGTREESLRVIRQSDVLAILDPSDEQEEDTGSPA